MAYSSTRASYARWFFPLFICCLPTVRSAAQPVVINEYSCSNFAGPVDPYGQREDWVELYNTTAAPISLSGYYLTDKITDLQNWQIPAGVTIPANGRMMVWCNDRGTFTSGALNPSFKLTQCRPERFILSTAAGVIVDSVTLLRTQANHSRGRTTNGATAWALFDTPTPNASNAGAKTAYVGKPVMNVTPGFYTSAQSVTLSAPGAGTGVTIRYTTDGSTPTGTSNAYTGTPIAVSATTVIRARAFSTDPQLLPSFIETNSYFINENISPTMNVVSVCGPFSTLFQNSQRIYNSYEFFNKARQFQFDLEGETRKHGNDSWSNAQKGMRFYARDGLGYRASMDYQIFPTSPRDTFNVVIMKAAGSDNYPDGPSAAAHLRDAFNHTLAEQFGMDMDLRRYEPSVLFINGQYWGIYELRERVDADYTEYYYGQPEKQIDMLRNWGGLNIEYGSDTGWNNLFNFIVNNNMAVPANYAHVKDFLRVQSLADYYILNTYLVNSDWLNWNSMWWRGRKGQGVKWRYALWDNDNTMGLGQNFTGWSTTGPTANPCAPFNFFPNSGPSNGHSRMINKLMDNPEFAQMYRDRMVDAFNGPLACPALHARLDSMVAILQPEMQRHVNRWGGSLTGWQNNVQNIRNWINTRCAYAVAALDTCLNLKVRTLVVNAIPTGKGAVALNGGNLTPLPWRRIMTADSQYALAAMPTQPYWTFSHWLHYADSNNFAPDTLTSAVIMDFWAKDSVVAVFKYFNPDSVAVTFVVDTPGYGEIELAGTLLPGYPHTQILDRRFAYSLKAIANNGYQFMRWEKLRDSTVISPSDTVASVSFAYRISDTLTARFRTVPPPPPPPPPVPPLPQTPPPPQIPLNLALGIPSAFSPNGDGRNDRFGVTGTADLRHIDLRVVNRYGETVFTARSPYSRWDGQHKGVPCDAGVYFYTITVEWSNHQRYKTQTFSGEVTLIR